MPTNSEKIEKKLKLLPKMPGCYLMKDKNGKIIYVGKAKNLYNRVHSYFKSEHTGKTAQLVENIADFETIVTSNEKESFLLEITLIQKHQPYYNIKLKRGTGYPFIKITNERDPRLLLVNNVKKDGGYYFGPYPNVYAAEETIRFLQKVYPLRHCQGYQGRPCLYYHMGQCLGACFKKVPKEKYDEQIKKIKDFLNGKTNKIVTKLQQEMQQASENMEYERAADLRDQLKYIDATVERQKIIADDNKPRDIINFYAERGWLSIQIFFIRQSRLLKRVKYLLPIVSDNAIDEFETFVIEFYQQQNVILPKEIILPKQLPESVLETINSILCTNVKLAFRGKKRELIELAGKNARLALEEKFRLLELDDSKTIKAVDELSNILNIQTAHHIEAFDHSHEQGTDIVSAMVYFKDGQPDKNNYRKFKLKTVDHADEAASTREVIRRRYSRLLKEEKPLPDLILMDGGIVQINAAKDVLENELNLNIPLAGMVKNDKHKTADLISENDDYLNLNPKSNAFYLLQRIQDEVHRFAITFHTQLHNKNALSSHLDSIKGVGPKTRNKLLRKYGSMKKISEADINDIKALGISYSLAQTIKITANAIVNNEKRKSMVHHQN